MLKVLALVAFFVVSINAAQTTCRPEFTAGPPFMGVCPITTLLTSDGICCFEIEVVTVVNPPPQCVDRTNANGVNECPGMKSYCTNSVYRTIMTQQCPRTCGICAGSNPPPSTCVDLNNPNTERSDCPANAGLCNNNVYRDLMKKQCPKTCGYCR